jgi:glycosyltransferase involved in cell wall biosynthesis
MNMDITLALPAYNEESNIARVLQEAITALEDIGRPWEIILVDNCSSDRTAEVGLAVAEKEPRVRVISHDENRLYSGSCATAMREAKGKYVAILDSDGQVVPTDIPRFLEKLEAGTNVVFGWRNPRRDPFSRLAMSAVFNFLGKWYIKFPLHDLNCGFRMFDRKFIENVEITHRINMSNPEMYTRAKIAGLKMDEATIEHYERKGGETSHDFRKLFGVLVGVQRHFRDLGRELKQSS